jgi:formylglycine-generating enzyme required for sulfatase activity
MSTVGPNLGMGPVHYQVHKIKKCDEKVIDSCKSSTGCCAVVSCEYCLKWEAYGEEPVFGLASSTGEGGITGEVDGMEFVADWVRRDTPVIEDEYENSVGMRFAKIPAGAFYMGSPEDEVGRDADEERVLINFEDDFTLQTTQVTQVQYEAVVGSNPSTFLDPANPVETLTYAQAQAFCSILSSLPEEIAAGRSYRLPTEAEWEYGCRARLETPYNYGTDPGLLSDNAWFEDNSGGMTHPVGEKSANRWGLSDMHGNVWEWASKSRLGGTETDQVIRGGAYDSPEEECRSAERELVPEDIAESNIGFRVLMVPTPQIQSMCFLDVYVNDVLQAQIPLCGETGVTCRNLSYILGQLVTKNDYYGYETEPGELSWTRRELRPMPLRKDEFLCTHKFCGNCDCTCRELCVTFTIPAVYIGLDDDLTCTTVLAESEYQTDCDGPVWEGEVQCGDKTKYLSFAIEKDVYSDDCVFVAQVNDEEITYPLYDCSDIDFTFELEDGTSITVRCKGCEECEEVCPDDACACEFSTPTCVRGDIVSTTEPDDECAGDVVAGSPITVPGGWDKPWVEGEDTANQYIFDGFNITIPCGLDPLALIGVLVRRSPNPTEDAPGVDYNIVEPCDYYLVMYDALGNVASINYSYALCCSPAFASPLCTTRLVWIKFSGVPAGRGVYDFIFWRPRGTDLITSCGMDENPCES